MKTNSTTQQNISGRESTYALLVRSEERERSLFETAVYTLLILCGVVSIFQFAHQTITIPARLGSDTQIASAECIAGGRC